MSTAASQTTIPTFDRRFDAATCIVLAIAAVRLLLWAFFGHQYGIFRDELYYLACSEHVDWGYVDQPPMIAFITWLVRNTLGDSVHALRFLPAVAGAALVVLTARLARRMGGGTWAQALAALAALVAPVYLSLSHLMTMNAFEPLLWVAIAYLVVVIAQGGSEKLWLAVGVLAGVGLQTKYSVAFLLAGLAVGLVLTRERRLLKSGWLWVGVALAAAIALPNFLWQYNRDFPFLELMRNISRSGRDVKLSPIDFVLQQILIMQPVSFVLWAGGVAWLFTRSGRAFRVLGWAFLFTFGTLLAMKGKSYYVAPAYGMVFAAGGVALEQWTRKRTSWLLTVLTILLIASSVVLLPMTMPVLSPEGFIAYTNKLGLRPPATEHQQNGPLENQLYADMFGWEELAREVGRAYAALPSDVRERTGIIVNSYGQGGAIDFFGSRYGLPKSIGVHQNYWIWGPRDYTGESLIVLGDDYESLAPQCASVEKIGRNEHPLSRRDEHYDILWCRGLKGHLRDAWPKLKEWN